MKIFVFVICINLIFLWDSKVISNIIESNHVISFLTFAQKVNQG